MTPFSPVILWNKKVHLRAAATTCNKRYFSCFRLGHQSYNDGINCADPRPFPDPLAYAKGVFLLIYLYLFF